MLLESGAPPTLVALSRGRYGIAVIPSNTRIADRSLRALSILQRGAPIGRWVSVAWDPRRFLAPYAERFVDQLVPYASRAYSGAALGRRIPLAPPA